MTTPTNRHTAIPWYESETDFDAVIEIFPFDESQASLTYSEYLACLDKAENKVKSEGKIPVRIKIEAIPFKAWCESSDLPICNKSTVLYSMAILGEKLLNEREKSK